MIFLQTIYFIAAIIHKNDLFHGDIKPSNIFFDKNYSIMTTDAGSILYLLESN